MVTRVSRHVVMLFLDVWVVAKASPSGCKSVLRSSRVLLCRFLGAYCSGLLK